MDNEEYGDPLLVGVVQVCTVKGLAGTYSLMFLATLTYCDDMCLYQHGFCDAPSPDNPLNQQYEIDLFSCPLQCCQLLHSIV